MYLPRPEDIKDIPPRQLPEIAVNYFVDRARYLGNLAIESIDDFDRFMELDFMERYAIHFALADRTYKISKEKSSTERNIYLVDVVPPGDIAGLGEVSQSLTSVSPYAANKPLVLNTETVGGFQRQGYGQRRYLAMNAASLLIFGKPLHSREAGSMRTTQATRRWEALVRSSLAEAYDEPNADGRTVQRYRFKTAAS